MVHVCGDVVSVVVVVVGVTSVVGGVGVNVSSCAVMLLDI